MGRATLTRLAHDPENRPRFSERIMRKTKKSQLTHNSRP